MSAAAIVERLEHDARGRRVAWGLALGMESTGFLNYESARVQVDNRGNILVHSGLTSHGQGQATTLSRVCAKALGVDEGRVSIRLGDTQLLPFGRGTFASRGAVVGANAVHGATVRLRTRALVRRAPVASDPATLTIAGGRIERNNGEATSLTLADIARALQPYGQLYGTAAALEETLSSIPEQADVCAVGPRRQGRTDARTGNYQVIDYLVVHDTGVMLDETIVEGQLIGAVADGVGGTMLSELLYDDQAQLLTGGLADYLVASAAEAPRVRLITFRRCRRPIL